MKRVRRDPYKEGSLLKIAQMFLKPLVLLKPKGQDLKDWLEEIFQIKSVEIKRYRAKTNFTMLGAFLEAASKPVLGLGMREIKKGDRIWVRKDYGPEGKIHIELVNVGKADQVFELDTSEYFHTLPFLDEMRSNE